MIAKFARQLASLDFDREDVIILLALSLVTAGIWSWSASIALIACGALLLWVFLPPRPPFIEPPAKRDRRTS